VPDELLGLSQKSAGFNRVADDVTHRDLCRLVLDSDALGELVRARLSKPDEGRAHLTHHRRS
jgi:hypothetical protein